LICNFSLYPLSFCVYCRDASWIGVIYKSQGIFGAPASKLVQNHLGIYGPQGGAFSSNDLVLILYIFSACNHSAYG
jgi:hypothetical protein